MCGGALFAVSKPVMAHSWEEPLEMSAGNLQEKLLEQSAGNQQNQSFLGSLLSLFDDYLPFCRSII